MSKIKKKNTEEELKASTVMDRPKCLRHELSLLGPFVENATTNSARTLNVDNSLGTEI